MFEDTIRAIRSRKSKISKGQSEKWKKDRQYNGHKIPKGQSEAVNGRKTDNIMATGYQKANQKKDRQYNG